MQATMPLRLAGLWSGPSTDISLITSITSSVTTTDSVILEPPWRTRWPTALISARSSMTPHSRSTRASMTSPRAVPWSGIGALFSPLHCSLLYLSLASAPWLTATRSQRPLARLFSSFIWNSSYLSEELPQLMTNIIDTSP